MSELALMNPAPGMNVATPVANSIEDESLRTTTDATARSGTAQPADPNAMQMPSVGRVGLALVVVIGGILLLRAVARRFMLLPGGVKSNKAVKVLSRSILAPKQHVLLLQVGRRVIVVGDSAGRLSPLCEIGDPDEVASLVSQAGNERAEPTKAGFGKMFGRARDSFAPEPDAAADEMPAEPNVSAVPEEGSADIGQLLERVRSMQQQLR